MIARHSLVDHFKVYMMKDPDTYVSFVLATMLSLSALVCCRHFIYVCFNAFFLLGSVNDVESWIVQEKQILMKSRQGSLII